MLFRSETGTASELKTSGQKNPRKDNNFIIKEAEDIISSYMEESRRQSAGTPPGPTAAVREESKAKNRFMANLVINSALTGSILLLVYFITRLI